MKPRYEVSLEMKRDEKAELMFSQTLEYVQGEKDLNKSGQSTREMHEQSTMSDFKPKTLFKTLTLLKCAFKVGDEERVKHHIKFRNKVAKAELEQMQQRLNQVCKVIK